jgi:hypothetical protein
MAVGFRGLYKSNEGLLEALSYTIRGIKSGGRDRQGM